MKEYLIAHDLGTSGDKASLFSTEGELVCSYTVPYDVHYFHKNCAEQNPEDWWQAVCTATAKITEGIDPSRVLALSFSAQMQCCLPVDKEGRPLHPAMIWADQRAGQQASQLSRRLGADRMYAITGHRVSASYSLEKLMWLKDNKPEVYRATCKMLQAKDFIIYRLTGRFLTDYSDASGTNALDLKNLCWSREILDASGVSPDKLPELFPSTHIAGNLTAEAGSALGLTPSTKVVCGGGDGPCSALGAGCIHPGELFLTFGTSAWIGGTTREVFTDEEQALFCFAHIIPGCYMPCGTMQSAGSTYSYMKETFFQDVAAQAARSGQSAYSLLNQLIANSPAGAKGLIYLPYMLGERSPRWNPHAFGTFLGIRPEHNRNDYLRAALEGVAMNLELILKDYRRSMTADHLVLTGGGAKGDIVASILADVLKASLSRPDHVEEATSIAAAVTAGVGIGLYEDFSQVSRFLKIKDTTAPSLENAAVYDKLKPVFDQAYDALVPVFDNLFHI